MRQMIYDGDHTSFTTWEQIAQLASTTQAVTNEVSELSWAPEEGDENAVKPAASIWTGKLVQLREGAMRIGVEGDLVSIAVNGKVQLAPSRENKQVDVWLTAGIHDLTIFAAAKKGAAGLSATRVRANSSSAQPQLKPFNKGDFDLAAAAHFFEEKESAGSSKAKAINMDFGQIELRKETQEFAAGEINKIWSLDNYIELCNYLESKNKTIVFFIGPDELFLKEKLKKLYPHSIFIEDHITGYQNIEIIMATTKYLQLAISNDSGVSHMLSTGYCPLIKLFGPKDSTKFTPENRNLFSISSSAFNSKNINKIPVSRVIEEIEKVLI